MLSVKKIDAPITIQPSVLTYNNLASVCALATVPRIISDSDTNTTYFWGSNDWVINQIEAIFVDMQKKDYNHMVTEVEIYPIVYAISGQERADMEGVLEIDGKHYFTGTMLNFKVVKGWESCISLTRIRKQDFDKCIHVEYTIFLEQSLDGEPYSVQELILMMINSALNQYRRLSYVPHEELPITINIAESAVNMIKRSEDILSTDKFLSLKGFLDRHLSGDVNPETSATYQRVAPFWEYSLKGEKIDRQIIYFSLLDDTTTRKMETNFPIVYRDIWKAYQDSFDINRYRTL